MALHRAIQSIRNGECEQAIVGAVNLLLSPKGFIGFDSMGYLSEKGQAKSFQADANGFVRSEGAGVLIIKPLQKAIEDSDHIYSVIKGSGVSHGGRGMSLHAPNPAGMKDAMLKAYQGAQIDPKTVTYRSAWDRLSIGRRDRNRGVKVRLQSARIGTSTGSTGGSAMLYQQLKAEHRTR